MTTRQRYKQQTGTYRVLIGITKEVVGSGQAALKTTDKMHGKDIFADLAIKEIREQIAHFCGWESR